MLTASLPVLVYAFSSGPPSEHTGGFGEQTCTACHVGTALNGGPGRVTISGAPSTYTSGTVYPITVRVEDPNMRRWGFEMSSRVQASGAQAGSFTPTNNQTQLLATFNGIQYIGHTTAGTRNGTTGGVNFTFNWTAPNTSAGTVVFHAAGNAANGGGTENGDRIYSTFAVIPAQVAGPAPTVAEGATVNNGSFALHPAPLARGSIAAIFGSNLNDGTAVCGSSFGADGKLVTSICGTSVTFGGIAAPLFFSSPGQLAVQVPYEIPVDQGVANVVVTVNGQSSEPRTVFLDTAAPGIFTLSQNGSGPGAVLIANSDILAVATGSVPGRTTRPARRGEIVTIFLTGLGATSPALGTGVPSTGQTTATAATVTIDGLPAQVLFSGTAPGFVGLNQINVTVPAAATIGNSVPVLVTLGGKVSNTVTMAVSQ